MPIHEKKWAAGETKQVDEVLDAPNQRSAWVEMSGKHYVSLPPEWDGTISVYIRFTSDETAEGIFTGDFFTAAGVYSGEMPLEEECFLQLRTSADFTGSTEMRISQGRGDA